MFENIREIISSFQKRVDILQQDWTVLTEAAAAAENTPTLQKQISILKAKLDLVQNQHTGIIIDLGHIKAELCKEQLNNNIFYNGFDTCYPKDKENIEPLKNFKKRTIDIALLGEELNEPLGSIFRNHKDVDENIEGCQLLNELPYNHRAWKRQYSEDIKNKSLSGVPRECNYQLIMTECPKSVAELYEEFYTDTKPQIIRFEEKFGAGQLSKLPKLRTYQRRSALVNAINKYAKGSNISVEQAISYFQNIVDENDKTIPWLYNNLAKIMEQYLIPQ